MTLIRSAVSYAGFVLNLDPLAAVRHMYEGRYVFFVDEGRKMYFSTDRF